MMTFVKALSDMAKLVGLELHSITGKSDIRVLSVSQEGVSLRTESGRDCFRSREKLQQVWDALAEEESIHVDSILKGSRSSRNQPESLFANLPYIKYVYVDDRKHLVLKPKPSYTLGTLKGE